MRTINTLVMLTMFCVASAQSSYYPIDLSHSQIKFMGHLGGMMDVEGTFGNFWGYVNFDEDQTDRTSVTLLIEASSVVSGNEWRDKHLRNPEFLDVENHELIMFQSNSVKKTGEIFQASGSLNLRGQVRQLTIPMKLIYAPTPDPWGNSRMGFKGSLQFSRKQLDMGPTEGFWANSIADNFEMEFVISASQQNMDRMSHFERGPMKEIYELAEQGETDIVKDKLMMAQQEGKLQSALVNQIAMRLDQHQKADEALKIYQMNTELFSEDHSTFSNLALAYVDRGNVEKAKQIAQKALAINPKDALALEILK